MSYQIVRVAKYKGGAVRGIQTHDRREKISKTNPDIDRSRTAQNYELGPEQDRSCHVAVKERIAELNLPKAVRSDAVVMMGAVVTSDKEFFDKLSPVGQKEFFQDSLKFLERHFGKDNIISATVHMDEKTPHMHVNIVPEHEGRLCAKELITPAKLRGMQDIYQAEVGSKYGLERGGDNPDKRQKHLSVPEYKAMMAKVTELESKAIVAEKRLDSLTKQGDEALARRNEVQAELGAAKSELADVTDKISIQAEVLEDVTHNVNSEMSKLQNITQEVESMSARHGELVSSVQELSDNKAGLLRECAALSEEKGKLLGLFDAVKDFLGKAGGLVNVYNSLRDEMAAIDPPTLKSTKALISLEKIAPRMAELAAALSPMMKAAQQIAQVISQALPGRQRGHGMER